MNKVIIDGKINCITDDNKKYIKFGLTNKHNNLSIYPSFNIERTLYNKNKDLFFKGNEVLIKGFLNTYKKGNSILSFVTVDEIEDINNYWINNLYNDEYWNGKKCEPNLVSEEVQRKFEEKLKRLRNGKE